VQDYDELIKIINQFGSSQTLQEKQAAMINYSAKAELAFQHTSNFINFLDNNRKFLKPEDYVATRSKLQDFQIEINQASILMQAYVQQEYDAQRITQQQYLDLLKLLVTFV